MTHRLRRSLKGHLYKQETEENARVCKLLTKLSVQNELDRFLPYLSTVVVHDTRNIAMFMSTDQTFFVSSNTLELLDGDE